MDTPSAARLRCCCTYKGNQIFANHNRCEALNKAVGVVVVPTKVIKFLLITTPISRVSNFRLLLLYLQR